MSDRRKLKPEKPGKLPDFLVTVMSACTIKIYGTKDAEEAKERATNRVRGLFDGVDSELYIPRAMVVPGNLSPEELQKYMEGQKPHERKD